jgi:hypothetical protein
VMVRNRLNSIENWVKPPKPSKSRARQAERAVAELQAASEIKLASETATLTSHLTAVAAPGSFASPRPVSQFIRTSVLAAHR